MRHGLRTAAKLFNETLRRPHKQEEIVRRPSLVKLPAVPARQTAVTQVRARQDVLRQVKLVPLTLERRP